MSDASRSGEPSPEGLALNLRYAVGRRLGSGAQAAVHAVVDRSTGHETPWVVKMAPLPDKPAPPKKKKSLLEVNADSLYGEYHQYDLFRSLQGTVIPALPLWKNAQRDVPVKGEITSSNPKYRFLVLERMEAPFFSLVHKLEAPRAVADGIALGPIFTSMIDHARAFHTMGHVFVDVKADNFMLASASEEEESMLGKKQPKVSSLLHAQGLADRIRWLDLSLARTYRNHVTKNGTHVENTGGQSIVGTPLYSSLHAHQGETLSRRDDVFAVLLVLSELVIRIQARFDNSTDRYQPNRHNKFPSFLPWANETSLEALAARKSEQVLDPTSDFYRRMPRNVASLMHQWLVQAHELPFSKEPPYEDWKQAMRSLTLPWFTAATTATTGLRGRATKAGTTRPKGAALVAGPTTGDDDGASKLESAGQVRAATASVAPTKAAASKVALKRPPVSFDSPVAPVNKKLAKSAAARENTTTTTEALDAAGPGAIIPAPTTDSNVRGIALRAVDGPLQGKSFYLVKGHCDKIVVGTAPTAKSGTTVAIPGDSLEKTHAKLSLVLTAGGTRIVKVECLGEGASTTVNGAVILRNASGRAFQNDTIGLGSSAFKVSYFDGPLSILGKENTDV